MKKYLTGWLVFGLIVVANGVFSCQTQPGDQNGQETKANDSKNTLTRVGQKVPSFQVTTLNGKSINITDLKGKTILLNFFTTRCNACIKEMPYLEEAIWQKLKSEKFMIIAIGRAHSDSELTTFKEKHRLTFSLAPDPNRQVYRLFADKYVPRNYVINPYGKIVFQSMGYVPAELRKMKDIIQKELQKSSNEARK